MSVTVKFMEIGRKILKGMGNTFKGREYLLWVLDGDDEMPITPYEDFRRIMLSRNVKTNNSKLHNRIVHHFNPNKEHWLKKFMNLYLQDNEQSEEICQSSG